MGNLPRVLALRQLRYSPFCVIAILLIAGWCGAAEGENDSLEAEDPGSLDRVIRRIHPKAPPLPREEERPPSSRLFNLGFEQGDWDVIIEDSASDSEVMVVYSYIKKRAYCSPQARAKILSCTPSFLTGNEQSMPFTHTDISVFYKLRRVV